MVDKLNNHESVYMRSSLTILMLSSSLISTWSGMWARQVL